MSKTPFVAILCVVAIVVLCIFGYNQFNNRTCKLCDEKVYKEGLCKEHYTKTLAMDNLNDVINGEKEFGDAIKDVYDKSLTQDEKKQLEDSFEGLKNSFNEIGKLLK